MVIALCSHDNVFSSSLNINHGGPFTSCAIASAVCIFKGSHNEEPDHCFGSRSRILRRHFDAFSGSDDASPLRREDREASRPRPLGRQKGTRLPLSGSKSAAGGLCRRQPGSPGLNEYCKLQLAATASASISENRIQLLKAPGTIAISASLPVSTACRAASSE